MVVNGPAMGSFRESTGSTERLEMAKLNEHHHADELRSYDDERDNESDEGDEHDGKALLGHGHEAGHVPMKRVREQNTWRFVSGILIETIPTLLLSTVGLTFTGELLEQVAESRAIKRVNELYILIPMLNNLKGNLEMNLSSRLSTAANVGELDVQALLVSAVAAILSFLLGLVISPTTEPPNSNPPTRRLMHKRWIQVRQSSFESERSKSGLRELTMVLSTSMASASISGLILGSFMCSLILLCRRWRRDPDNITPPIASCLGDLLTLCIIDLVSSILVRTIDSALPLVLLIFFLVTTVSAIMLTLRNQYVRHLIFLGWSPLLGAMVISSGAGIVLDRYVDQYEGFGLLSIVLGGLPGAVGSVLVSRISTSLHISTSDKSSDSRATQKPRTLATFLTLSLITIPVQAIFLAFTQAAGWTKFPFLFIIVFVLICCLTVLISLAFAEILTRFLWRRGLDPDLYAMPIHSSFIDLVAQFMLVACYEIVQALGADVKISS